MVVLQKFDFKESKYDRPQDKWVCGHLADGKPCALGPGPDGACRVTTVCQPRMENGRWECRRSQQEGGACEGGPLPDGRCCKTLTPCVPQPNLRTKRKRSALWATALVVGLVAVILGGGAGDHLLMPGQLSSHHAGLSECVTCHAGAGPGKMAWLHQFVASVGPEQNSKLCMGCHSMGMQPFAPHTYPVEPLKQITQARAGGPSIHVDSWIERVAFPLSSLKPMAGERDIYCATCHKEHQGVFHDLTTVSNERCQTCHVAKFGSFADSHPEFEKYPYTRRTRIIFDHESHFGKHFPEVKKAAIPGQVAPTGCDDCHQTGVRQRYMEVKSFETVCSGCHNGDIAGTTRASGPKGIDFLSVPGLDVATLAERGIDIGDWPKRSEAVLTPFMRELLAANGENVAAGVAGLELLDLSKASDADLAKVQDLAWAIKHLFRRLESAKLETAMGMSADGSPMQMDRQRMAELTGAMSHDVVMGGNHDWFPNLKDDLLRHDRGEPTSSFKPPEKKPEAESKAKSSAATPAGKSTNSDDILSPSPGAAPSGDILGPSSDSAPSADILAPSSGKESSDNILAPSSDSAPSADILAPSSGKESSADILAPSPKSASSDDILAPGGDAPDPLLGGDKAGSSGSAKSGSDDSILGGSDQPGKAAAAPDRGKTKAAEVPQEVFDPEGWAASGGWYRQDFTIRYRPTGHADGFIRTWLDFSGHAYGTRKQDLLAPIFERLSPQDAVGRCTKCHSIDADDGAKIVNWQPFDPAQVRKRFTTFSHKPHIAAVGSKSCAACHQLNPPGGDYLKTYADGNPAVYTPNFQHVDKALCATCHTRQAAWENCTLCHNYHVSDAGAEVGRRASLRQPSWARSYDPSTGRPRR